MGDSGSIRRETIGVTVWEKGAYLVKVFLLSSQIFD